jgi:Na+/H+ antiporter NhaD/arsenite permease-like protein
MLRLAAEHRLDARLLLVTLAFAVTTGSVASPIGNPQNLLIATTSKIRHTGPMDVVHPVIHEWGR